MIQTLTDIFISFFSLYPYSISYFGTFFGGEEVILFLAGLSAYGYINFWALFFFCLIGTMSSDCLVFFLARTRIVNKIRTWKNAAGGYEKFVHVMGKTIKNNTFLSLLITKFLYGTRIITIVYFSRERLAFRKFFAYNIVVVGVWLSLILPIGWLGGKGLGLFAAIFKDIQLGIFLILIAAIIVYITRRWISNLILQRKN